MINKFAANRKHNKDVCDTKKPLSKADLDWLRQPAHHLIKITDADYPPLLKETVDAPARLFAIGDRQLLAEPKFAVVGSRRPTPVGEKITRSFSEQLSCLGLVITSGMALGIDGVAHQAVLDNQCPTIAVLGCGLDTIYPSRHWRLFEKISDQGLVLSEYSIGIPPLRAYFPQRNRIISGLSYGVLIIEAAERSGTLITARLAMEQNREVFVIPGSTVNPQYRGSHQLIRQGAVLVQSVEDILQELTISLAEVTKPAQSKQTRGSDNPVLAAVGYESTLVDEIISTSGLTAAEVSSMLLVLEVDGLIAVTEQGGYVKLT